MDPGTAEIRREIRVTLDSDATRGSNQQPAISSASGPSATKAPEQASIVDELFVAVKSEPDASAAAVDKAARKAARKEAKHAADADADAADSGSVKKEKKRRRKKDDAAGADG